MSKKPIIFTTDKELQYGPNLGRAGTISTPHGDIPTPAFISVGTKATIKAITAKQLIDDVGADAALANTYHLFLQPGPEVIKAAGGLHSFMGIDKPLYTDSGGFQVMSLGQGFGNDLNKFASQEEVAKKKISKKTPKNQLAKVDEEGVTFKSHLDGSCKRLTPESSMQIQHDLGADIMFAFDELPAVDSSPEYQLEAMERTHRWAARCVEFHNQAEASSRQGLFGVVQGGMYEDLRISAARTMAEMDFAGYGIGGSYTKESMADMLRWTNENLPSEKPRHLLGIGAEPIDFFIGVENGADTFDCVAPTRMARNGTLLTHDGKLNLLNKVHVTDFAALDADCDCYTCQNHSRAYLSHLFRSKEMLASTLASIHNLHYVVTLVKQIRQSILEDRYQKFRDEIVARFY